MAARTRRITQNDKIREKIQAGMLIKGLHDHFEGKRDLSATQLKSAEILLRKSVPDLSAVEMTSDVNLKGEVAIRPVLTREEWLKLHKAK